MPPQTPQKANQQLSKTSTEFDRYSSPKYYFTLVITLLVIAVILIFYLIISKTPTLQNTQTQVTIASSSSSSVTLENSYVASTNYNLTLDLPDKSQSIVLPNKIQTYSITQKCVINALQTYKDQYIITDGMFRGGEFFRIANDYEINISNKNHLINLKYLNRDLNIKFAKDSNIEVTLSQKAFEKFKTFTKLDANNCDELQASDFIYKVSYSNNTPGSELVLGTKDDFTLGSVTIYQKIDNTRVLNNWRALVSYSFNSKFETFDETYFDLNLILYNFSAAEEFTNSQTVLSLEDIKKSAFTNSTGYGTPNNLKIEGYEIFYLNQNTKTIPMLLINTDYLPLYYRLTN